MQFFGQGVLGGEFQFQFIGQVLVFEFFVFVDVGRNYFVDLVGFQQLVEVEVVDVGIVVDYCQFVFVVVMQGCDQGFGDVVQVEVIDGQGYVVFYQFFEGMLCIWIDFVYCYCFFFVVQLCVYVL